MKKLNLLKTLLDLFYFFTLLTVVLITVFGIMALFGDEAIPLKIKGEEITVSGWSEKLLVVILMISFFCFIYAILLLRKVVGYFVKREIFDEKVIENLNKIGKFLIAAALLQNIPLFVYKMVVRNHVGFEFGIDGFDSLLLAVGLGLFFMVLSEVFKIAKNFKEDSELSV